MKRFGTTRKLDARASHPSDLRQFVDLRECSFRSRFKNDCATIIIQHVRGGVPREKTAFASTHLRTIGKSRSWSDITKPTSTLGVK